MSFDDAFLLVLAEEGVKINAITGEVIDSGYNKQPDDRGGETKFGISERYLGRSPKDLTLSEAKTLYRVDFWDGPGCEKVNERSKGLALMLFDCCVNQGVGAAIRLFQKAVGVTPDGVIGPITLGKITIDKEETILLDFALNRIERYNHLALVDKTQLKFLGGWLIRVCNILRSSRKLL
jgi:lysozyme family protein